MRLKLTGVAKRFGELSLFQNLSLTVTEGEMVAITGPSGSGKSTLLAVMSGLLPADSGRVELFDENNQAWSPMRESEAAWVPQGSNALGARTVLDNAVIGGLARGERRVHAERLAADSLSLMGLDSRLEDRASVLSGGELQRLGVARALCGNRPFLFADEPTGSLDRFNTETVIAALRRAADSGKAVVIATHDPAVVPSCDRVLVLDGSLESL